LASTHDQTTSRARTLDDTHRGSAHVDVHHHGGVDGAVAQGGGLKRVSWGAIFAGAVIGIATLLLLTLLGLGIGTATLDPAPGGDGTPGAGALASGSGIWLVGSQLVALLVGGYVAGRLAGVPRKQGSVLHGAAVWAVATLAMFWLATTAVGNIAGGTASLLGKAGGAVGSSVQAALPDDLSVESLIPNIGMNDLPPEVRQTMRERDLAPQDIRAEIEGIASTVVGPQERDRALQIARSTASDVVSSPGDAAQDVTSMVDQLFAGPDAVISDEDREQLKGEVAARFDISEAEAQRTVDRWQARANEAVATIEQNVVQAQARAAEAAQTAAESVSTAAFLAFVASLVGLIAAAVGGLLGRPKHASIEHAD